MHSKRQSTLCTRHPRRHLGLCYRATTSLATSDVDLRSRFQSASFEMLGIQLGRTSAFRTTARRTNVVANAALDPADASTRKPTQTGAPCLSWSLTQLGSFVQGMGSTRPPPPSGEQLTATTTTTAIPSRHSPSVSSAVSDKADTINAGNDNNACIPLSRDAGNINDHVRPEQRTSSTASTSGRDSTRFHFQVPYHFHLATTGPVNIQNHAHHGPKRHRLTHHHHQHRENYYQGAALQHTDVHSLAASLRHPTLRLIASRLRAGSKPGARRDRARLGLVVEGGGMRGCISGAMLMGLQDLGLVDVFDAVYGASAGAINATYYLSGQRHGLKIYHEDLTRGTSFLDFRNLFSNSSQPVMNIDFLIDEVMSTIKPLDWNAVLSSPTPLKVVASCLDSLQPVILSDFADRHELAEALKATAAVPQIAGPPRRLRGRTLVDAAVFEPVPVPSAIRDGCTHLLVLCTRPPRRSPWARRVSDTIEVLAKTTILNAPYMRDAWRISGGTEHSSPSANDQQLVSALASCPHEFRQRVGAYVLPLYPEHTAGCHPLCLNPEKLIAACEVGHKALVRLLGPVVLAVAPGTAAAVATLADLRNEEELGRIAEIVLGDVKGEVDLANDLSGTAVMGLGRGRGEFGDAELYSADMDLRFRP